MKKEDKELFSLHRCWTKDGKAFYRLVFNDSVYIENDIDEQEVIKFLLPYVGVGVGFLVGRIHSIDD